MEQCKLNSLVVEYRTSRCQKSFEGAYHAMNELRIVNERMILRSYCGDESDAQEIFDTVIERVIDRGEPEGFKKLLSASLRNARIDFIRQIQRRRQRTVSLEAYVSDEEDALTLYSVMVADSDTELEALEKKKRAEQLALIDSLLRPCRTDSVAIAVATKLSHYDSENALAKALSLDHKRVRRKLRKLSLNYDANRFGDINDYLAV
jgi:DNA-directed RNA polymerase specialized sigma24 family protein